MFISYAREDGDVAARALHARLATDAPDVMAWLDRYAAMPFNKELQDVYVFGIQGPVNEAGYLCERMDMVSFTGDILARIKSRIETAALVIADLSGANANVYLEVGYA